MLVEIVKRFVAGVLFVIVAIAYMSAVALGIFISLAGVGFMLSIPSLRVLIVILFAVYLIVLISSIVNKFR